MAAQDRLVELLGTRTTERVEVVALMLRREPSETTAYWLQLAVSVGIATLGLVVGSSAVVIGAMLVAPLMGPIVGLAMGLAAGSPFLVLRTAQRTLGSVAIAIAGAAAITIVLPYHELNVEIAGRASPTLLDLVTASFCALAGVYAALRPGSATATTAAGTSIGISLVPPLCASGYGFGTATWGVAGGAGLLFLTNLVAIVVVGTVSFVACGFNRVDVTVLERAELEREGGRVSLIRPLASRLSHLFASRWGPALRFLMPFALLAGVYVPLGRALDEVAWQVSTRAAVDEAIARVPLRVVQSRVRVERRALDVTLVVLGDMKEAEAVRGQLDEQIRRASGVTARLEVFAVADAAEVEGLATSLRAPRAVEAPVVAPPPSDDEQLESARARVRRTLETLWPMASAGRALAVDLGADGDPLRVRVVHVGAALAPEAVEALERSIATSLERPVRLVDAAIVPGPWDRTRGDAALLATVIAGVRDTRDLADVRVCLVRPAPPTRPRRRPRAEDVALEASLEAALAPHSRVERRMGETWSVRFADGPCDATPSAAPAPPPRTREPVSS